MHRLIHFAFSDLDVHPEVQGQMKYIRKHGEVEAEIKKFNLTSRRMTFTMKEVDGNGAEDPLTWLNVSLQLLQFICSLIR